MFRKSWIAGWEHLQFWFFHLGEVTNDHNHSASLAPCAGAPE